jgi:hypothetical protein
MHEQVLSSIRWLPMPYHKWQHEWHESRDFQLVLEGLQRQPLDTRALALESHKAMN